MRVVYGGSIAGARRVDGHVLHARREPAEVQQNQQVGTGKNVRVTRINGQRIYFADLARLAFPNKTEANLAFLAKVDARTARRWLADDNEPPAEVLGIILAEIMRRFHQR